MSTSPARSLIKISLEVARLDEEIEQRSQELKDLRDRRKMLMGPLEAVMRGDTDAQEQVARCEVEVATSTSATINPVRSRSSLKERVLASFRERMGEVVTARDIAQAIGELNRVDAIRTTLHRLSSRDKLITKKGHGQYVLETDQGGPQGETMP